MDESAASNVPNIDTVVNEAITEGRKLTNYLLNGAAYLDAAEGMVAPDTCQLDVNSATMSLLMQQWSHHVETGRSPITIRSLEEALNALRVGFEEGSFPDCLASRPVDTKAFPYGHNIPVRLAQDKQYWSIIPESDQGRYEMIYNIRDGIIIFGYIKKPTGKALQGLDAIMPGAKRFMKPCDVIGTMFQRLHAQSHPRNADSKAKVASAEKMAEKAVSDQSPLAGLPADTTGWFLPAARTNPEAISGLMIERYMRKFLNYIIVHVNARYQAYSIVAHFIPDIIRRTWEDRETFMIGQEDYYAMLGSDMGQEVAWLLAKRKGEGVHGLGRRAIRSITVFFGGRSPEMTTEEIVKYCTPVMLFEVVDASDELCALQQSHESNNA